MLGLIVEEEVGFEFAKEGGLFLAVEERGFAGFSFPFDLPSHQGADGAFMRGGAACGDQRGAEPPVR